MTKQQQIDLLQQKLDAANKHIADVDGVLREQYLNIATSIISEIKSWFKERCYNGIVLCYKDVYNYLDDLRKNVESNAPEYKPSVLCELVLSLAEARRQLAEQRIKAEFDKRVLKDRLNLIYGIKSSKLPNGGQDD